MTQQENEFNLIEGTFTGPEASEILSALFRDKMRFHNEKNFSNRERLGAPDQRAEERVPILMKTQERALAYLKSHSETTAFELYADIRIRPLV